MLLDDHASRPSGTDQAEGLRRRKRTEASSTSSRTPSSGPRVILISELPGTDLGARLAFQIARALAQPLADGTAQSSLLVDLAPAASRLPDALAEWVRPDDYSSLWTDMAAGRSLSPVDTNPSLRVAVAAEPQMTPLSLEQLPRLYEQFVRQLSRPVRWDWVVLLALDHLLPLDKPCWQVADDLLLLSNSDDHAYGRHAGVLRCRLPDVDPHRRIWTLPVGSMAAQTRWPRWIARMESATGASAKKNSDANANSVTSRGLLFRRCASALQLALPMRLRGKGIWSGSRLLRSRQAADLLARRWSHEGVSARTLPAGVARGVDAQGVASALRWAAGCEDSGESVKLSGYEKKIQLGAQHQTITQLSEVFRA